MAKGDKIVQLSLDFYSTGAIPIVATKPKAHTKQTVFMPEFYKDMTSMELDIVLYLLNQLSTRTGFGLESYSVFNLIYDLPIKYLWPDTKQIPYARLSNSCTLLGKRAITIDDKENQRGVTVPLFSLVSWNAANGVIRVEINRRLQEFFLELTHGFADYVYMDTWLFKKHHAKKLFILFAYKYKLMYSTYRVNLEELFALLGVPKCNSRVQQYLERYIIPTVDVINLKSETMRVKFELDKDTVTKQWSIVFKPKQKELPSASTPTDLSGMDEKQMNAYLSIKSYNVEDRIAVDIARSKAMEYHKWLYNNKLRFYEPGPKGIKNPGAVIVTHFGYNTKKEKTS